MKKAKRTVSVFGTNGDYVIGAIDCGVKTLVLGETDKGTIIAYMLGIVKPECSEFLVEEREWSSTANEKEKLLCFAEESMSNKTEYFIDEYLKMRGIKGGYRYVDCDYKKAGDVVLGLGGRCIGVYMGDGSAVVQDKQGRMCRLDTVELKKIQFARPMHLDFEREEAVYTRRLKKIKRCMEGDDVRAVQKTLSVLGLFAGKLSGKFTTKTKRAVEEFQKKNGLSVDGTVDYAVWKLLTGGVS